MKANKRVVGLGTLVLIERSLSMEQALLQEHDTDIGGFGETNRNERILFHSVERVKIFSSHQMDNNGQQGPESISY